MIQKYKLTKSKYYLIASFAVIAVTLVATFSVITAHNTRAESPTRVEPPVASVFSFETAKIPDWRGGPGGKTDFVIFANDHSCFSSIQYHQGTVEAAIEKQKEQDAFLTKGGYTRTPTGVATITISTDATPQSMQVQQYAVSGNGAAGQLYGGQAFGYTQLDKGYLYLQTYCNTADQLPGALNAAQGLRYASIAR